MKYCQNCGTPLEDDAKFCHNCGTPTTEDQSATLASASTENPTSPSPHAETATPDAQSGAENSNEEKSEILNESNQKPLNEDCKAKSTTSKKSPLGSIFCVLLVLAVIVVIFVQCSGTSKSQILETAKTFTMDSSNVTLGEAVETNLRDVEWTCYDQDDGYWTVTVSGYNANEDATVSLLIGVTEISDDQVYYEPIYGEVNGNGSMEASDINYAIAVIYDNVDQALVDSLTNYLLGL